MATIEPTAAKPITTNGNNQPTKEKPTRTRPKKILPTDRIGFTKQLELLRAYAAAAGPTGKAVSLNDAAAIVKMVSATVSLASPFFTDVGFLQRTETGFVPATEVVNFGHAHEWNPETASHKLAPLLAHTWFAEVLTPRITFRPVSDAEAIQALAEASSAAKDYEGQLSTLIDYLEAAGLCIRENGQVRKAGGAQMNEQPATAVAPAAATSPEKEQTKPSVSTSFSKQSLGEGRVQFNVSVTVSMAEFSSWQGDRIEKFFHGIAEVLKAKAAIEQETDKE
jgi:hypothetical protein